MPFKKVLECLCVWWEVGGGTEKGGETENLLKTSTYLIISNLLLNLL